MANITSNTTTNDDVIPQAVSQRICTHMNDDHAVSVFAMAKSLMIADPSWKITNCQLTAVTKDGCQMDAVLCKQQLCKKERVVYSFDPPLETAAEARKRLVAIHHRVTRPLTWFKNPLVVMSLPILFALIWCVLVVGSERMVTAIEARPELHGIVTDNARPLVQLLRMGVAFAIMEHLVLCTYVAYHAMKTLQLKVASVSLWYISVAIGGIFAFREFQQLLLVHNNANSKPKSG